MLKKNTVKPILETKLSTSIWLEPKCLFLRNQSASFFEVSMSSKHPSRYTHCATTPADRRPPLPFYSGLSPVNAILRAAVGICFSRTWARVSPGARHAHSGCDFLELEGVPSVWMASSLAEVAWRHRRYHGISLACL